MSIPAMKRASFEELKNEKIRLRRAGRKDGVAYANVEREMKARFGRT